MRKSIVLLRDMGPSREGTEDQQAGVVLLTETGPSRDWTGVPQAGDDGKQRMGKQNTCLCSLFPWEAAEVLDKGIHRLNGDCKVSESHASSHCLRRGWHLHSGRWLE